MKTNHTYFFKTILFLLLIESALMGQHQLPKLVTPELQDSITSMLQNLNSQNLEMKNDSEIVEQELSPLRFGLVVGASAGIITVAHLQNYNSWWKGERSPFHLDNDENANLYADKFGHFLFSYVASDIMTQSFYWSGMKQQNAALLGGGIALAFQLYVEIEDAFHPNLGFSIGDGVADIAGAAIPFLRVQYPSLHSVTFKWSVIPSPRFRNGEFRSLIDDYESQYYWLSVNIKNALGKHAPDFLPSFLNIALGYGVKNLSSSKESELYLSLDIDFTKLPGEGGFISTLKRVLNYFHAPMPTLKISPSVVAYGIRF
ncbi:MAG: DUF2279 domain-containing protein [Ignavibacteriae bacterium]|nr:DUF2279 domain-containing protein [Ignavibacteriota bacterium]